MGCFGAIDGARTMSPRRLPAKISALNARPKKDGSVRIIGNKSCPPKGSYQSILRDDGSFGDEGPGRPIASNYNVVKRRDRSYLQIEDNSEAAATIHAMASTCGLAVVGRATMVPNDRVVAGRAVA